MVEYRKKRSRSEWLPSAVTKTFQNIFCVDNQTVGNDFHSMGGGGGGGYYRSQWVPETVILCELPLYVTFKNTVFSKYALCGKYTVLI